MAFFPAGYDIFKATSVEQLYKHFFRTLYNNASKLLIINGLPEKVNPDFVMSQLLLVGRIAAFKNNGDITMLNCNVGGEVNEYYVPQRVLIANPIIGSKDLKRDEEAVVIHLTPMDILTEYPKSSPCFAFEGGIHSLISMCANLLADNISSINTAQINTRVHAVFTAEDESAAKTAEEVLRRIYSGKPYSVVTSEMLKKFTVNPLSNSAVSKDLIELLEVCQYINAMFWNALGIDCNYNMKRERLITAEVDKNLMSLKVSIETILETLNADFEKCNSILGTSLSAELNPEFDVQMSDEGEPCSNDGGDVTTENNDENESEEDDEDVRKNRKDTSEVD